MHCLRRDVRVTNVVDFGIFVKIVPGESGLVHRTQLAIGDDPVEDYFEIGDTVDVEVLAYRNGRYSLALKEEELHSKDTEEERNRGFSVSAASE